MNGWQDRTRKAACRKDAVAPPAALGGRARSSTTATRPPPLLASTCPATALTSEGSHPRPPTTTAHTCTASQTPWVIAAAGVLALAD